MRRHISQREAHQLQRTLRKRDEELDALKDMWASPYSGVKVRTIKLTEQGAVDVLDVVPKLNRLLIARLDGIELKIYAVPTALKK